MDVAVLRLAKTATLANASASDTSVKHSLTIQRSLLRGSRHFASPLTHTLADARLHWGLVVAQDSKLPDMAEILRQIPNVSFSKRDTEWYWTIPKGPSGYVSSSSYAKHVPVKLKFDYATGRQYWLYKKKVYVTTDLKLKPADVAALGNEAENKRRLRLEKAHALQSMVKQLDTRAKRAPIPQDVKMTVWQRDGGRCVACESQQNLEFDHVIPVAMGGSNTARNLQLLCETCNRRKGATLG